MSVPLRPLIAFVLATLVAGAIGGWLGVVYGERLTPPTHDLHTVIHRDLDLTSEQNQRIATLETQFAERRQTLEAEMRAANRDLAEALVTDHRFGPREEAAVDRFHRAEKQLQEATIRHVLAMRAVLDPRQSKTFDHAVYEALTGPS